MMMRLKSKDDSYHSNDHDDSDYFVIKMKGMIETKMKPELKFQIGSLAPSYN